MDVGGGVLDERGSADDQLAVRYGAGAGVGAPSRWGVLRHGHFRNVWLAAFVSNVGTWMEQVGVQMVVAKRTGNLAVLGSLGAAQLFPILVLGIFGGLLADRVDRKKLLIWTQLMLMGTAGFLAWASAGGWASVPVFFGVMIAQGVIMAFNFPAWQVLTPRLVPKAELTRAITLNGIQFNAARFVGPAAAGVILGMWGATPLFVLNTLSFLAVLVAVMRTPPAPALPRNGQAAWGQVREAARFMFREKGPRCVFLAMVVMSLLAAPLIRILPLYAIDVYGLEGGKADATFGALLAVLGVGAILGGVVLRWMPGWYPKHHFIPLALSCCGLTVGLLATTTTAAAGYVAIFVCGIFWIWGFNQSWAAMQHLVSDGMRGRVMAIANVFAFGVTALGNVGAGSAGEWLGRVMKSEAMGTRATVAGLGVMLLGAGVVMLTWRTPEVDGLKPGDAGYERRPGLWRGIVASAHAPNSRG